MADQSTPLTTAGDASLIEEQQARLEVADATEVKESADANGSIQSEAVEPEGVAIDAPGKSVDSEKQSNQQLDSDEAESEKPIVEQEDAILQEDAQEDVQPEESSSLPTATEEAGQAVDTPISSTKAKIPRRKSGGVPEHKKKLNKKASKAKMTHTDAQPGDYFYVRLKGYPLWPAIVCEESMLPPTLIKTRPVTAARPDGSYRVDYQDGGSKVKDRTFAVMYLHTNEFGWIPNYDLVDLDFSTVGEVTPKMRKDLAAAHELAAQQYDLNYFKHLLLSFNQAREADNLAREQAQADKEAKAAEKAAEKAAHKKTSKKPSKAALVHTDEDVDMPDVQADPESGDAKSPGTAKRPRDEEGNNESNKKMKLSFKVKTPKAANGTSTPKTKEASSSKPSKPKSKKSASKVLATPEAALPREPEPTAEERHTTKNKEILFLRHKLQKGLLTRDQPLKEDEMKQMSEYVSKLEGYAELEVSIIRATKINKVLKAILKLPSIPREEEFEFKPRSQDLLDKWNKLLASEQGTPSAPTTNGATIAKVEGNDAKVSPGESTNGLQHTAGDVKTEGEAAESVDVKAEQQNEGNDSTTKSVDIGIKSAQEDAPVTNETLEASNSQPTAVEPTA